MDNNQSLTISLKSSTEIGMDLQELMKQGLEIIQTFCGESGQWTNYNVSDPGITILEYFCYAITDLSYRLSFPVQDLLTDGLDTQITKTKKKILFSAKEILTSTPLTINDYRKLLIDIPGVKNAWLTVANHPIRGLYQVFIEIKKPYKKNDVIENVKKKLHAYRNLCEDFYEIIQLEQQEISIVADIELNDNANIITLKDRLYRTVEQIISPEIPFYSFEELRAQGKSVEEIYDGPILNQGFINDEDLTQLDERKNIYIADIVEALHKIHTVKTVRKLLINNQEEVIKNDNNNVFSIKEFKVNLYKDGFLILTDEIQTPIYDTFQKKNTDCILSSGKYRNLATYNSIQHDLPHNYLLDSNNIHNGNINYKDQVSSKQLKAYLLIYDQILANYFADVNSIKASFNYIEDLLEKAPEELDKIKSTYSSQPVNSSDIELLVDKEYIDINGQKKSYQEKLQEITNEQSDNNRYIRKNRLLDYLLALFGETFTDYSVSSSKTDIDKLSVEQRLINKKITYLINLPELKGLRGKAVNYSLREDPYSTKKMIYPLQKSICNILGLSENELYVVEHILLRPFSQAHKDLNVVINDINLYSCKISVILPESKILGTLYSAIEEKIKEVSRNEVPAHITIYYHIWSDDKITEFREFYDDWLNTFADSSDLDMVSINSFVIAKILCCIKGIASMVIGDKEVNTKNYYYFTVFNGKDPLISGNKGINSMIIGDGVTTAKKYHYFTVFDHLSITDVAIINNE